GGDELLPAVTQLTGEKRDVSASPDDAAARPELARLGGGEELNLKIDGRRPLPGRQCRDERRPHRVVEHRREQPALDITCRIEELVGRGEGNVDDAGVRID